MSMVKRFKIPPHLEPMPGESAFAEVVLASDYDALAAELEARHRDRISELEAALRKLFDEIDSRFGNIADMSPELLEVMLEAKDALAGSAP